MTDVDELRHESARAEIRSLKSHYRSGTDDLAVDFFAPCLRSCSKYRRAVGFFSSSALVTWSSALPRIAENADFCIELLVSPHLQDGDKKTLSGLATPSERQKVLQKLADRIVLDALSFAERPEAADLRTRLFAWMVASGRLELRFAFATHIDSPGIFHEKIGVALFPWRDTVAFTGSANESTSAHSKNFESIHVFRDWEPADAERVEITKNDFSAAWEGTAPGLEILRLSQEAMQRVEQVAPAEFPREALEVAELPAASDGMPRIPVDIKLRKYQQSAIQNWFKANGRGTLKMATGSGKTITSLAIASNLSEAVGIKSLVVVCPFRHLVTQWDRECRRFGLRPFLAFEERSSWVVDLGIAIYNTQSGTTPLLCVITTNSTFQAEHFQSHLSRLPAPAMIIADEAHNLGAPALRECLPESVRFRLALSATPERWFDDHGTGELLSYFGDVLEPEFTLKDAIQQEALVPYRHYPVFVDLTEDELEEYLELSKRISQLWDGDDSIEDSPSLKALLIRRARLVAAATNKLVALRQLLSEHQQDSHMLFYCGDGSVEDDVTGDMHRHVDAVCKLLGAEFGVRVASYTAETPLDEREQLLQQLDEGVLQGLVAIRCLDEGVDVPSIRTAFILASSSNPRQFIQRRGRILRKSPGKTHATIYDFVVVPRHDDEITESERTLMRRELTRYVEFADLALNAGEARQRILGIQQRFGLLDL